jgi:hypothetical protein
MRARNSSTKLEIFTVSCARRLRLRPTRSQSKRVEIVLEIPELFFYSQRKIDIRLQISVGLTVPFSLSFVSLIPPRVLQVITETLLFNRSSLYRDQSTV